MIEIGTHLSQSNTLSVASGSNMPWLACFASGAHLAPLFSTYETYEISTATREPAYAYRQQTNSLTAKTASKQSVHAVSPGPPPPPPALHASYMRWVLDYC